jgi:mono/diheme cytochrome c family protein
MRNFWFLIFFVAGCTVNTIQPGNGLEMDMNIDWKAADIRHGWAVLTGAHVTKMGSIDGASIGRGKRLYQMHCQKCHGVAGKGDGPAAAKLKNKPADLSNLSDKTTETYIIVQINQGKGDMPKWQDYLSNKESWDLTNYVRTLNKKKK